MPSSTLTAGATRRTPPPGELLAPALVRIRRTAHSITGRVRHALLPDDAEFRPLRVLVVDDHPDAAESLAAVLGLLD
jgi:hypothetical protein